jgi:ATP-dependent RNA circularization protein (DNA/RNA ligase family)
MTAFFRFPHTPHVAWLGPGTPRNDKLLAPSDARELLAHVVVVEEKVDGANLGFSTDEDGYLRAQNRGSFLDLDAPQGQWKPLKRWLAIHRHTLTHALAPHLMLFGEWCYAVHSVRYTRLPDWFLAFDVYDRAKGEFWNVERRNELARRVGIAVVPELGRGRFDIAGLKLLLEKSQLTDGRAEGVYVRREAEGRLIARAKLVSPEFVQAIDEHWSKRGLVENLLDANRVDRSWQ